TYRLQLIARFLPMDSSFVSMRAALEAHKNYNNTFQAAVFVTSYTIPFFFAKIPKMPVQRRNYEGKEVLVSTSRDRLLVAFRLNDIARVLQIVELRSIAVETCHEDEIWDVPQVDGDETMITLEGARVLLNKIGGPQATSFRAWLDSEFPENAAISALGNDSILPETLYKVGEMRRENPGIELSEIAGRLAISEEVAKGYVVYSDLLRKLT
ncbi:MULTISPECIES: hypothetical protein, partial [unclassified Paraburkholderia]|uniref:hypothetical protein n=1 Tax=unclassified Paraburkholderia TaxID=2615204 RepID=UPI002AB0E86A